LTVARAGSYYERSAVLRPAGLNSNMRTPSPRNATPIKPTAPLEWVRMRISIAALIAAVLGQSDFIGAFFHSAYAAS
jgi:hypothetical protein